MHKPSRLLVIPDVHQDTSFLQHIFRSESLNEWDRVIFLGDFFDANAPDYANVASVAWICEFVIELKRELKERMVILLGNHDLFSMPCPAIRNDYPDSRRKCSWI